MSVSYLKPMKGIKNGISNTPKSQMITKKHSEYVLVIKNKKFQQKMFDKQKFDKQSFERTSQPLTAYQISCHSLK